MIEVLFSSEAEDNQVTCNAWDFRTGINLMVYKGGGSAQTRSLCLLRSEYVLAANSTKPLLHVWPINGQEQVGAVRFVLPGRVNALALSPCGQYLVAGIQETLYIWHLNSGRMLNTIAKHYQSVSVLRFTDDSSHFVSGGLDGGVLVWNLTQAVSRGFENQKPVYSFTDHGLPVTDVHLGVGGMRSYMSTVSMDRTCKVYDMSNGTLLLNVVFAEPLRSVTVNAFETSVYVGTADGQIYEFFIDALPRTKEYHMEKEHINKFSGHKEGTQVNCLAVSLDGQTLLSGGQDGQICVWHIGGRQLLKTFKRKGAITNLQLRLTSPAIFHPEHKQPHVFGGNLRRMIDPPETDDDLTIEVRVTEQNAIKAESEIFNVARTNTASNYERASKTNNTSAIRTSNGAGQDADELEKLRAEVQHLKRVNKQLFEVSVKQLLQLKQNDNNNHSN